MFMTSGTYSEQVMLIAVLSAELTGTVRDYVNLTGDTDQ